ncbi:type VI secretion system protein ImpK [Serratia fonticola]|uniref:Type VI secretion system protein ImpK n=1 Tax=Serratia fonticola TaxID=47917 RepID=A0A559T9I0_SERFO|nr:type VI secretion system protein TssL, short form [Serratia fonticola]TQI81197.1 type VI secretion system protein ImpK [Serratia fonticola]TQI96779.1 type VI secretion system protein ImpK [Serratia fonticola]TVZ71275.1 type VI secretion system protein ImpK [Serratia fonticola]
MTTSLSKESIAVDEIFHDTWLMVCQLRNGVPAQDGQALYRKACAQIDAARQALEAAGVAAPAAEHMLYAQCALLDETVMGRQAQDSGYSEWLKSPLQARYFNTLSAGELLWERIRTVLHDPVPDRNVLTCFHRVLLLGFSGRYREDGNQRREDVLAALARQVPPFTLPTKDALIVRPSARRYRSGRSTLWWRWLALVVVLAGLWWGLDTALQQLVHQRLP